MLKTDEFTPKLPAKIQQLNWDDLRCLSALSEAGSVHAASTRLRLDATTLLRRIRRLSAALGVDLIERRDSRYQLSETGAKVSEYGASIDGTIHDLVRHLGRDDLTLRGSVRVTALSSVMSRVIAPALPAFHAAYPDITLELLGEARNLSLARDEADIAIRFALPSGPELVGRKLNDVAFFPCSRRMEHAPDVETAPWLTYVEPMAHLPEAQWTSREIDPRRIIMRANGIETLAAMVRNGVGVALLPGYMLRADSRLTAIGPSPLSRELWMAVHADRRNIPRIRAVMEWLVDALSTGGSSGKPNHPG
ncbi:MAG: LysR family transcriptional regulator [Pseudomonadota bacterium]